MSDAAPPHPWNHNVHYHRLVLRAVPPHARTALDVGTGDGLLAADLRRRVPHVVGLDLDADVLSRARASAPHGAWVRGDALHAPFPPASFDVVTSIATLHHLPDPADALRALAGLTAPGGALVVVGCAASSGPADAAWDTLGVVQHQVLRRTRTFWEHSAPTVWPPPHTFAQVRDAARDALPGVRWRRLPLWRYLLVWHRPV
ncbi:bifunctional 2-polyprenyl-6-hydroxyphenol methylase/3-demethylubiquinol 3-O-methyltransferase UbiG [Cellulomonas sp. B6]|uniref:class I SAM-dependent methyltransferase n=1 Tax=Cellulomonas sp. B6 TaxID=1295626 RepID=UPI00073AF753|nr:class I SAM-dependent methyltransferase [Cellulomonas sp. B6]KSW14057.1 methyltransferase type 11 [Cellulomonas sp. B6]